jgi:hypothetical protein
MWRLEGMKDRTLKLELRVRLDCYLLELKRIEKSENLKGAKAQRAVSLRACLFFFTFFCIFFFFQNLRGGVGVEKFQGSSLQPAPHHAGSPNKPSWPAPMVRVLGSAGICSALLIGSLHFVFSNREELSFYLRQPAEL